MSTFTRCDGCGKEYNRDADAHWNAHRMGKRPEGVPYSQWDRYMDVCSDVCLLKLMRRDRRERDGGPSDG